MPNECNHLLPSICGRSRLPTISDSPCNHVYFTGLTDETIKRGDPFDPEQGVHAYDKNDEEVPYTYTPSSIDTSVVGEYTVTYKATGVGDAIKFTLCGDMALRTTDCNTETITESRKITVVSTDALVCDAITCESSIGC